MAIKIDGKLSTAAADGILADASEIQVSDGVMLDQKLAELEDSIETGGGGSSGDGLTEEQVREIVTEETADLQPLTEIDASVDEDTYVLTLELKDNEGNVLSTKEVELPKGSGETPNLTDYVKFTDYATASKAGVVFGGQQLGINVNANGRLNIMRATNEEIVDKKQECKPIVPNTLDYAVKVGITTNTETLTNDELRAFYKWIGAVQYYYEARNGIARFINGQLIVSTPTQGSHATTKSYVDNLVDNLLVTPYILNFSGDVSVSVIIPTAIHEYQEIPRRVYHAGYTSSENIYPIHGIATDNNIIVGMYSTDGQTLIVVTSEASELECESGYPLARL